MYLSPWPRRLGYKECLCPDAAAPVATSHRSPHAFAAQAAVVTAAAVRCTRCASITPAVATTAAVRCTRCGPTNRAVAMLMPIGMRRRSALRVQPP